MRRAIRLGLLSLLVLVPIWAALADEDPIRLPSAGDTWMNLDAINRATSAHLATYTWPAGQVANAAILKWNMASIHAGSTIIHATLSLYLEDWRGAEPYRVTVHRIINKNPTIAGATGFTYDGVNSWTANTCCYQNIPLAQADIALAAHVLSVPESTGYHHWHVTTILQTWVDDPTSVFGILVNSDAAASVDNFRTFVSDNGYADRRPILVVGFALSGTPPPPQPTPTHRSVTLDWTDNSDNEEGFHVEMRAYPPVGAFTRVHTMAANVRTWTDVFLATLARCYRVQAYNVAGASEYTNEACACVNFICIVGGLTRPPVISRPPVTSRPPVP